MRARHVYLVVDSCFSGSLFGTRALPPIDDRFYATLYEGRSRWGLSSGANEPVDDAGLDGHSPFAFYFLKTLRENEAPYLVPTEIHKHVGGAVMNYTHQTPLSQPLRKSRHKSGQFVFRLTGVQPKPQTVKPGPSPEGGAEVALAQVSKQIEKMHKEQKKQQELIEQQQKLIQKFNQKQSDPVQPPTPSVSSQSPAPPPALTPVNETLVATQKIALRQHPDLTGKLLGFVESGQQVEVLAETDGWYQVANGLNLAYVPTDSLRELRCKYVKVQQTTIRPEDLRIAQILPGAILNERDCLEQWKSALPEENSFLNSYVEEVTEGYCADHLDTPLDGINYDYDSFPSSPEDVDISQIKFSKKYPSGRIRRPYLCEITVPFRCTYEYKDDAPEGSKKICE